MLLKNTASGTKTLCKQRLSIELTSVGPERLKAIYKNTDQSPATIPVFIFFPALSINF